MAVRQSVWFLLPASAKMNDKSLLSRGITLKVGRIQNPVAEHAIEELGMELLHLSPKGGPTSAVTRNCSPVDW